MIVPASSGGCWFCLNDEGEMLFDTEFDTWIHEECLRSELKENPDNPEAQLMKYLLK